MSKYQIKLALSALYCSFIVVLFVPINVSANTPVAEDCASSVVVVPAGDIKDPNPPSNLTSGGSPKATGGPDAFGYTYIDSTEPGGPTYQWIEISSTGTNVPITDDDRFGPFNIGFSMPFYGSNYTQFWLSSNGWISIGSGDPGTSGLTNQCPLPDMANTPNSVIGGIWDDLDQNTSTPNGTGYYQAFPAGTCPYGSFTGACLVAEWYGMYHYGSAADNMTFEIILFDNGQILIQFLDASNELGSGSTTGIENSDGTIGLHYACNTANSIADGRAVLFENSGWTLSASITSQTGTAGSTLTFPFSISNNTGAAETFNMTYTGNTWTTSGPSSVGPVANGATANFNVTVTVPSGASECESDTCTVTAILQSDPTDNKSADITTNSPAASTIFYDNGDYVNLPGGGPGGMDGSVLQDSSLGMDTYGFGCGLSTGYRIADDFTVTDPAGWQVDNVIFYIYQTGSPTSPSPIASVNYRIWNGAPNAGGAVVFGDTTTDRMISSSWDNAYRTLESSPGDTSRAVMSITAEAGVLLTPGTYWLDWQVGGSATYSGPWQPPITITGQNTTGNALQYSGGSWVNLQDTGTYTNQGAPFTLLQCQGGSGCAITITPATLPAGTVGGAYSQTLSASGGTAPYTYAVTSGILPAGLTLNPTTGVISGTPSAGGSYTFTITATDSAACTGTITYTMDFSYGWNMSVVDDAGRSSACLNTDTGYFAWTVLTGFGAGTYVGHSNVTFAYNTYYFQSSMPSGMNMKINMNTNKASGTYISPPLRERSICIDADITDSPACP